MLDSLREWGERRYTRVFRENASKNTSSFEVACTVTKPPLFRRETEAFLECFRPGLYNGVETNPKMEGLMNNGIRKLPTGIQDFEKLREKDFVYVDKTSYIYTLAHSETPYFLSRPRRFGKSLLLSTFQAYWEGKKELFAGLAIEDLEKDNPDAWQPYPVFYFDFNRDGYEKESSLENLLDTHLREWEKVYGYEDISSSLAVRFQDLLARAYAQTGRRCVVLVDEYDKPLLDSLSSAPQVEHNKNVFKSFFGTLKSYDRYLQFVLITGVTKFSKVSIFSDINQLEDISLDDDYAGICGITREELLGNFGPELERMADARSLSTESCLDQLQKKYDGYHFSSGGPGVYNPYSLLNALKKRKFGSYWFETGTPTFLLKRMHQLHFDVKQLTDASLQTTEKRLSDYRAENPDPIPLLYQTGYLTIIKNADDPDGVYTLGFPNEEVSYGFLDGLLPEYTADCGSGSGKDILTLRRHFENGDLESIHNVLTALFASIPYAASGEAPFEHYFQTVLFLVFTLLGQYVHCELHTFTGRIDCTVETRNYIYLFEFKRDRPAAEALAQIEDAQYALPYAADPRKLFKIGVSFDSGSRMLAEWEVS